MASTLSYNTIKGFSEFFVRYSIIIIICDSWIFYTIPIIQINKLFNTWYLLSMIFYIFMVVCQWKSMLKSCVISIFGLTVAFLGFSQSGDIMYDDPFGSFTVLHLIIVCSHYKNFGASFCLNFQTCFLPI